jgi:uncharacterized protein YbjT (DUF2867 family)
MILVTGSTGKIGQQLVSALQQAGVSFRALARSDASAKELAARGVATVRGDLSDSASFHAALRGVERLFLLSAGADPHAAEADPIAAAKAAGVKHVVKLSALGADADATNSFLRGHARSERALEASGLAWTFVRPTFFMQNWVLYNAPGIRAGQPVYTNAGDARLAWVDTRDIAAVAATDEHQGRIYDLTGPQAFSYAEVGQQLGALLGRKVEHIAVSDHAAFAAMRGMGMPTDYAFALTTLNQAARRGLGAATTGTVELVTGRPARDLNAFLREHVEQFRG